jgi:hypothetical protein
VIRVLLGALLLVAASADASIDYEKLAGITAGLERREGHFVQHKYLASVDATLKSSGRYSFERDKMIRWLIEEPIRNELLLTADGLVDNPGAFGESSTGIAGNPAAAALGRMLFAILTADWEQLAEYFDIDGDLEGEHWQVTLTPRKQSLQASFTRIDLSGSKYPAEILLHETGGNWTRIRLE